MSKIVPHGMYLIGSLPLYQAVTHMWKPVITISWAHDGNMTTRSFHTEGTYQSEAEADTHGISFGQRLIDGEVTVLSMK